MTKEELKEYIKQLKLENGLEGIVFEIIDNAKEVNAALLNGIADTLDLQADFYEKVADILEEEARAYDSLNAEVNRIDGEMQNRRMEDIAELQETFTEGLDKILQELKPNQQQESSSNPATNPPESTAEPTASSVTA